MILLPPPLPLPYLFSCIWLHIHVLIWPTSLSNLLYLLKIFITIRHLQNKAIEFLYFFLFCFFCLIQRRQWSNSEFVPVCGFKKKHQRYMGPDYQVPLNCENLLLLFYWYIHSIFVVFLHVHSFIWQVYNAKNYS